MAGAALFARERCDVIVAVGGGSAIDCAKAIGIVHANGCDVREMEGADQVEMPGPPLICIPTTAGTAADISQFCIIVNSPDRYKMAIVSKTVVPDVALVDPECTLTMDPYLTACTGVDALTHAIEAFVSTASSPVVDVHALAAIKLVWNNLEQAVARRTTWRRARTCCSPACRPGWLSRTRASARCMRWRIPRRLSRPAARRMQRLLLEHVVRFNITEAPSRYAQVGEAIGIDMRGMSEREQAKRITEALAAAHADRHSRQPRDARRAFGGHSRSGRGTRSKDAHCHQPALCHRGRRTGDLWRSHLKSTTGRPGVPASSALASALPQELPPQLRQNVERLERFHTLLDQTTDFVILVACRTAR